MLQRALLLQLLLLGSVLLCYAQPQPDNYDPLKSTGEIPKDMLMKSSQKYELEKSTISKSDSKKDRKSKESFYLSANFEIDKMLLSGMVSFNDPITVYLNKIMDVLLKDEPALRKQVRVYTMKSTEVNAFATNQGIIFVNLGLLAKVKNEAELAFILAHEITHVEKKHSLNKYLKVQTIKRDKNLYKDLSLDDKMATVNHYSQELETEADEAGLTRYVKAGYSIEAIGGAFELLAYSHHPFTLDEFDYKWLESSTFSFPEEYYRQKLNAITSLEEEDEDEHDKDHSTHPSVPQRKANILGKVTNETEEGRKVYHVSDLDFKASRKFAQFEVCRLHAIRQQYDLAIYEAHSLLKEYPDNLYLKKLQLKALAAMAFITNNGINIGKWEDFVNEDLQGNTQRAYHFFLSLAVEGDYMATVATRFGWQLKQQYPQDKEIASIADSLMHLLFYEREVEPTYYSMTPRPQTEIDSILREYDFAKNPEKRKEYELALTKTTVDEVVKDTNNLTAPSVSVSHLPKKEEPASFPRLKNADNKEDDEDEAEDVVVATTPAEAKKLGIKLSGYSKYQLKNKDRYDIKGVTQDGTLVYNRTEAPVYRSTSENDEKADRDNNTTKNDAPGTEDTLAVKEVKYIHDFKKPLDADFHKYAFVDFAGDEAFMKMAKKLYNKKQNDSEFKMTKTQKKDKLREKQLNTNRGFALNIQKVVVVNPVYRKINLVKQEKQTYLTSEKNQKKFSGLLASNAKASGIKYQLIDNKNLKNKEVSTFNDLAFLNEWLSERLDLGNTVPLSAMELTEREALIKKYGTRYFMWTGNISVKEKDYMKGILIGYSVLMPAILPFTLPKMIRGGKYQIYYYLVYDLQENKMIVGDVVYSNQLERNDFLNSQIYYTFNQLKHKR